MLYEPKWKSLMANTTSPIFTPEECKDIIKIGHQQQPQYARVGHFDDKGKAAVGGKKDIKKITTISWIPFKLMPDMYRRIEATMLQVNGNHFGYEGMRITEMAQFTEYPKGGFYDWHMDADASCQNEPPVRKISMTVLLSDPADFKGGKLELLTEDVKLPQLIQGQAIFFCSLLRHRVNKVTKGIRRSLVMWFGGPPFK